MSNKIEEILAQRRGLQQEPTIQTDSDKFFSVLIGEGLTEEFFELRFRDGLQTCFNYGKLFWFNHNPEEGCIDLDFEGFLITVKGRGLEPLFSGIKTKRVAWVKEANDTMQDHAENACFIEDITITPPQEFTDGP